MNSIFVKDRYIKCPNCSNIIKSSVPVCSKCGLMASEEGVHELAVIDDRNFVANSAADDLLLYSAAPFSLLAVSYVLSRFVPEFGVTPLFASAVALIMFWWKFVRWNRLYSEIQYPDELHAEAKLKIKKAAISGLIATTLLTAFIYTKFVDV